MSEEAMNRKCLVLGMILWLAVAVEVLAAPAATAVSSATTASKTRPCTGASTLTLDARRVGRLIMVSVDLATQSASRWWDIQLSQNGNTISSQAKRTGLDGSLTVQRTTGNLAGLDHFTAVTTTSGSQPESCSVNVTVGASRTR
jgi:hypothetical protein